MKRFIVSTALLLTMAVSVFAAGSDMTPLVVVKLNGSETITVKSVKDRVNFWMKQYDMQEMSLDNKKAVLDNLINEKLFAQAAAKEGISITDSQIDQGFLTAMSQRLGQQFTTESQLSDYLQKIANKSLSAFVKDISGLSLSDYKAYLKNQILCQNYVFAKKQDEFKKIAATDEEIRNYYRLNPVVRNEMVKLFIVLVPKGKDAASAKKKLEKILKDYNKQPSKSRDDFEVTLAKDEDNHKAYEAGYMNMTTQQAQQYGWDAKKVVELFDRKKGYVSELSETDTDFQFFVVKDHYAQKNLSIDDVVYPDSTVTVYEYIKQGLTQQKQSQFLAQASQDLYKSLDTKSNVDRKKTGDALDKLLNWESE